MTSSTDWKWNVVRVNLVLHNRVTGEFLGVFNHTRSFYTRNEDITQAINRILKFESNEVSKFRVNTFSRTIDSLLRGLDYPAWFGNTVTPVTVGGKLTINNIWYTLNTFKLDEAELLPDYEWCVIDLRTDILGIFKRIPTNEKGDVFVESQKIIDAATG